MRRGYEIELYLEKVDLIRRLIPDAAVTTDIIVGFCGETEEEFRRTYELVERLEFDKVHVAAYSPRQGTIAYRKLEDDVPHEVKMARLHAIEQLEAQISARINSRLLGQDVEVLVEGEKLRPEPVEGLRPEPVEGLRPEPVEGPRPEPVEGPRPEPVEGPAGAVALFGRTRQNKLVHFPAGEGPAPRRGDLVTVRIERTSPWSLAGSMVRAAAEAAARG